MQTQTNTTTFPLTPHQLIMQRIEGLEAKYESAVATMNTYELAVRALDEQLSAFPAGDEATWPQLNAIKNLESFIKDQRKYADALTDCISNHQDHLAV